MDNVAALQWVQDNIAGFGGAADRVTIFGESSGAGSVSQLMGVEAAWPYFHQGIMESGTASFWTYLTLDAAEGSFRTLTAKASCSGSGVVGCLLDAGAALVSSAVTAVPCRDGCTWAPVVDGVYVPGKTLDLVQAGRWRPQTPFIAGFNLNDGAMFVPGFPISEYTMTAKSLSSYFSDRFGEERVATLTATFPVPAGSPFSSDYFSSAQACETDFSYACTAQWVAVAASSPAYVYQFSMPSSAGTALHGDEIGYVFGTLKNPTADQSYVSSLMMGYWTAFAKSGDPNGGGLPSWPAWGSSAPIANISATPSLAHAPDDSFVGCGFFHEHWDYYSSCLPPTEAEATHEAAQ